MVNVKLSTPVREPADARTIKSSLPLKSLGGVPEKVLVWALNESHPGRG